MDHTRPKAAQPSNADAATPSIPIARKAVSASGERGAAVRQIHRSIKAWREEDDAKQAEPEASSAENEQAKEGEGSPPEAGAEDGAKAEKTGETGEAEAAGEETEASGTGETGEADAETGEREVEEKPAEVAQKKTSVAAKLKSLSRKVMRTPAASAAPAAGAANVPTTFDTYVAHVQQKFAGPIGELKAMGDQFKASGGEAKRLTQSLELSLESVQQLRAEFETKKGELDEKKRQKQEATVRAQELAQPNAGANMAQLLAKAKELVAQIDSKTGPTKTQKDLLEGTMNAAMVLATQIDPEGSGKGRLLYESIDTKENPALVEQGRRGGMPEAAVAAMAVNHRNWLRTFFRQTLMADQTNAEILFLRDQGIAGSRSGLTIEQVMAKVISNMQKPDPVTKQAVLPKDFTLTTATPQQLDQIYAGVIGSAATTNAGVTGNMTGGPRPPRPG